jgi:hypothetical protein
MPAILQGMPIVFRAGLSKIVVDVVYVTVKCDLHRTRAGKMPHLPQVDAQSRDCKRDRKLAR